MRFHLSDDYNSNDVRLDDEPGAFIEPRVSMCNRTLESNHGTKTLENLPMELDNISAPDHTKDQLN